MYVIAGNLCKTYRNDEVANGSRVSKENEIGQCKSETVCNQVIEINYNKIWIENSLLLCYYKKQKTRKDGFTNGSLQKRVY